MCMDIFAHGFWSFAIFHRFKHKWLAAFLGVAPDIFSFGLLFFANIMGGVFHVGKPELESIPPYVFMLYNMTHSLVVFGMVFVLVYVLTKKWFVPLLAWALHILIDIPTHTHAFFPTPFLWPLSDVKISGISWSDPAFMVLNYGALISVYFFLFVKKRKKKN